MSRFDLERFTADTRKDRSMADEAARLRPQALAEWAASRGYELTLDEARGLVSSTAELSDDELENVAGGWDEPQPPGGGD